MVAATASMLFASVSYAANYTETGDAGDLLSTAQVVISSDGTTTMPLNTLSGALTLTNGISDSDAFAIYISSPSAFSASMLNFVPGANNFDSQLMLFNSQGLGVYENDDAPGGGSSQSDLPSGTSLMSMQAAGVYYLVVSGSGRYAIDGTSSTTNLIFPNYTDGTTDPTGVYGPNGNAGALAGYTGNSSEAGNYVIALTGASFIPEPSTYACILAGAASLGFVMRARRRAAK